MAGGTFTPGMASNGIETLKAIEIIPNPLPGATASSRLPQFPRHLASSAGFVADSSLEESRFEPLVPLTTETVLRTRIRRPGLSRIGPVNFGSTIVNPCLSIAQTTRFLADSPLEGARFELVWGFSCQ